MDEYDLQVVAAHELGGGDEVLRAQAQEPAAHDARQSRPADDRQDDRDQQVVLKLRPVPRQRRAQRHPQRQLRNRQQDLDGALHDVVDDASQISGDTADQDPQKEADGHAEQSDGQRDPAAVQDAAVQVAAQTVAAQEVKRHAGAFGSEEMTVQREPEELVFESLREGHEPGFFFDDFAELHLEGFRVHRLAKGIDDRK